MQGIFAPSARMWVADFGGSERSTTDEDKTAVGCWMGIEPVDVGKPESQYRLRPLKIGWAGGKYADTGRRARHHALPSLRYDRDFSRNLTSQTCCEARGYCGATIFEGHIAVHIGADAADGDARVPGLPMRKPKPSRQRTVSTRTRLQSGVKRSNRKLAFSALRPPSNPAPRSGYRYRGLAAPAQQPKWAVINFGERWATSRFLSEHFSP